jgi:hypothetical protein
MTAWIACHQCRLFVPWLDLFFLTGGVFIGLVMARLAELKRA